MSNTNDDLIAQLHAKYILSLPAKVEELLTISRQVKKSDEVNSYFLLLVHRLAGSSGTYGLKPLHIACRTLEDKLRIEFNHEVIEPALAELEAIIDGIKQAND